MLPEKVDVYPFFDLSLSVFFSVEETSGGRGTIRTGDQRASLSFFSLSVVVVSGFFFFESIKLEALFFKKLFCSRPRVDVHFDGGAGRASREPWTGARSLKKPQKGLRWV